MFDFLLGASGNQQQAFDDYARQMREAAARFNPWIEAGQRGLGSAESEFAKLISNPNFLQDKISKGFYESPYQNLIQNLTQQRMNMNAANTGMLGSGAANRALQNELTGMTGQFLNEYIQRGLGSYGQGLQGMMGLSTGGLGALESTMPLLGEAAGANLKGAQSEQAAKANLLGSLLGIGGGLVGGFLGGPTGSKMGSELGKGIGGGGGSTFDLSKLFGNAGGA